MKIRMLVLHRHESYPGEHAPEVLAVVDEWTLDENPQWWANEVAEHKERIGNQAAAWAEVDATLSTDELMKALYPTHEVGLTVQG